MSWLIVMAAPSSSLPNLTWLDLDASINCVLSRHICWFTLVANNRHHRHTFTSLLYLVGFIFRNYPPGDSDSSYIQKALKSAVNAHIHWDNICTRSGTALYIKELPSAIPDEIDAAGTVVVREGHVRVPLRLAADHPRRSACVCLATGWSWIRARRRRRQGVPNLAVGPAATAAASAREAGLGRRSSRARSTWEGAWSEVDGEGSGVG